MTKVYKLYNQIKHYEWGSSVILPEFLGLVNEKALPFAELWMGTHSGSPSQVEQNGKLINLAEVSGELPFLFKLLAVENPLSIQVHPEKEQAVSGFKLEEEKGIPLSAPNRTYKDANEKSEIICALLPFKLMAGFRDFSLIIEAFNELSSAADQIKDFISSLTTLLKNNLLLDFLKKLFSISKDEMEYLCKIILSAEIDKTLFAQTGFAVSREQWELMKQFAKLYPNDIAVLSPLYLNVLTLQPGQAVFIPAGILHAYISGFAVELMNNSDNVLRGGLTSKYVNISELLKILKFKTFIPQIINPDTKNIFCYDTPCDFNLTVIKNEKSLDNKQFNDSVCTNRVCTNKVCKNRVCIVTEGEVSADGFIFKKGESFYVPKETENLPLAGNFSLYTASSA